MTEPAVSLSDAPSSAPHFLVHNEGDHVGVAVQDVAAGPARAVYMDSDRESTLEATERIPLGHKIALVDLAPEAEVIEYGVRVGIARAGIPRGSLVHVHNIRSSRWQHSL